MGIGACRGASPLHYRYPPSPLGKAYLKNKGLNIVLEIPAKNPEELKRSPKTILKILQKN